MSEGGADKLRGRDALSYRPQVSTQQTFTAATIPPVWKALRDEAEVRLPEYDAEVQPHLQELIDATRTIRPPDSLSERETWRVTPLPLELSRPAIDQMWSLWESVTGGLEGR